MSDFLTPLRLEYVNPWEYRNDGPWHENDGVARWQLLEPFKYYSSVLARVVTVPEGFRSDLASVPTLPLAYSLFGTRYSRAAVVHDYLCRYRLLAREQADRVFLEAMRLENAMEVVAMTRSGKDQDDINEHRAKLEGRAFSMYMGVSLYTKSGQWKTEVDKSGYEPIG